MLSSLPCFLFLLNLLSLHPVTFLMFLSPFFSSRCMLELKYAVYHRAASLSSEVSSVLVDVCSSGWRIDQALFKPLATAKSVTLPVMGDHVWSPQLYYFGNSTQSFIVWSLLTWQKREPFWRQYKSLPAKYAVKIKEVTIKGYVAWCINLCTVTAISLKMFDQPTLERAQPSQPSDQPADWS